MKQSISCITPRGNVYTISEQEYGRMEGKVVSISPVPNEEGNYVAEIGLIRMPDKQPPILKVMNGTAEIIVREQSLLERLFMH